MRVAAPVPAPPRTGGAARFAGCTPRLARRAALLAGRTERFTGCTALLARRAALLAGCAALLTGCGAPTVTRAVGGRLIEGRFISPHSYTLYAIGAEAEARGDLARALAAYEEAEDSDPDSADIWTRIGAVRCRLGEGDAAEAFERARSIEPDFEPAFREQARCDLSAGRLRAALDRIEQAIVLDPERDDGALLQAEILQRLGRTDDARRALWALTVRRPRSVAAWRALHAFALGTGDHATAEQAARRLRELAPREGAPSAQRPVVTRSLDEIDEALVAGELRRARRLALEADVPSPEIAVRAAALGRIREAREQAELVAAADPSSASAFVALAVAADLSGDEEALARACDALTSLPAGSGAWVPPSPLARLLLAELLARRVGREAAIAWLGPAPERAESADDPLLQHVEQRVRRELALPPP